jgi:hypothetical protein
MDTSTPTFYILSKFHKSDVPSWPILSVIDFPAHQIPIQAIFHTIPILATNAENSRHSMVILNELTINEGNTVSFDAESLFTRVMDTWHLEIIQAYLTPAEHSANTSFFVYQEKFY